MVLLYVWLVMSGVRLASMRTNVLLAIKQPFVSIIMQISFVIAELAIIRRLRLLNYAVFVILAV